jgi:outer membrane protein TolC
MLTSSITITVRRLVSGCAFPLLNAFFAKNQLALAKINLKNAEYVEQATRMQLKQSIEQAYFTMNAAYERYKTLQRQVADFSSLFVPQKFALTQALLPGGLPDRKE